MSVRDVKHMEPDSRRVTRGGRDRVPTVSVIIPTLNEATTISECLQNLRKQAADEIVVVDGGSSDATVALALGVGVTLIETLPGRGHQMNQGACASRGDILLFVHADCRLETGTLWDLRDRLARNPGIHAGCLRMRIAGRDPRYRLIDAAAHLRAGVLGIPYGDQAIFVRRSTFEAIGGFPETPLMEDVLIALRLRQIGRLALFAKHVEVSDRRWRNQGVLGQTIRNWLLTIGAAIGVPLSTLARYYPAIRQATRTRHGGESVTFSLDRAAPSTTSASLLRASKVDPRPKNDSSRGKSTEPDLPRKPPSG